MTAAINSRFPNTWITCDTTTEVVRAISSICCKNKFLNPKIAIQLNSPLECYSYTQEWGVWVTKGLLFRAISNAKGFRARADKHGMVWNLTTRWTGAEQPTTLPLEQTVLYTKAQRAFLTSIWASWAFLERISGYNWTLFIYVISFWSWNEHSSRFGFHLLYPKFKGIIHSLVNNFMETLFFIKQRLQLFSEFHLKWKNKRNLEV